MFDLTTKSAWRKSGRRTCDAVRATKLLENLARSLRRVLSTTNAVENLNSIARGVCHRVKHWRSGTMILRWTGAAMREAERKLRRVQGFKVGTPLLLDALQRNDERIDGRDERIDAREEMKRQGK